MLVSVGIVPLQAVINWHVVIEHARIPDGPEQSRAWDLIYTAFEKELRSLIKSLVGQRLRSETDDMFHDVVIQARRSFDTFAVQGDDARASLRNWLFTITRRHVGRYVQKRRREVPDDEVVGKAMATHVGNMPLRQVTELMLAGVSDEDVLLSFCRGIEELSYTEVVAEIEAFRAREALPGTTGLSEEILRLRWMRLRERFKTFLRDKITGPWQAHNAVKS